MGYRKRGGGGLIWKRDVDAFAGVKFISFTRNIYFLSKHSKHAMLGHYDI